MTASTNPAWTHDQGGDPADQKLEDYVFSALPLTENIRLASRAYRTGSPWALLLKAFMVAACDAPRARVNLETGINSVPLNMICGFIGRSGAGKGQTMDAPIVGANPQTSTVGGLGIKRVTPGSGEDLCSAFFEDKPDPSDPTKTVPTQDHTRPVWATWSEVDGKSAKSDKDSSTISAVTRSLWTGERAGDTSISRKKSGIGCIVEPEYRFVADIGIQPRRAKADNGGGDVQRYINAMVRDIHNLEEDEIAPARALLAQRLGKKTVSPNMPTLTVWGPTGDIIVTPDIVRRADTFRKLVQREDESIPEEQTHRVNLTVRIAAIFAGWRAGQGNTAVIDAAAWDWADAVMEHSARTYAYMRAVMKGERTQTAKERGREQALTAQARQEEEAAQVEDDVEHIFQKLLKEPLTARELHSKLPDGRRETKRKNRAINVGLEYGRFRRDAVNRLFPVVNGNVYDPNSLFVHSEKTSPLRAV